MAEIYVLMLKNSSLGARPQIAHTTMQGAAMEMAGNTAYEQHGMWVETIELVDDHDS